MLIFKIKFSKLEILHLSIATILVTAFSAIPFIPFKFIAPGAVVIDLSDRSKFGRVAFIGPLTNLIMGFIFFILSHQYPLIGYLYIGALFNSWIALFNLLPFGNLDGQKIFSWNKIVWIFMMVCTMGLFVLINT